MHTLLTLPQPIRLRIYHHVLLTPLPSPPTTTSLLTLESSHKIQRIHRHGAAISEVAIERCIRYPFTVLLPFAGLLRACRLTRRELKACMAVLKRRAARVVFQLQVLVHGERVMYPWWAVCPMRAGEMGRLEVEVRLDGFHVPELDMDGHVQLREHGRARCRTLAFALVALVARLIERGPRWEHLKSGEMKIHSLALNFHSRADLHLDERRLLQRSNSVEEERGLMAHLALSGSEQAGGDDTQSVTSSLASDRTFCSSSSSSSASMMGGYDPEEVVDAADLLRTVDLVLRPLLREEKYMVERRRRHFSMAHLGLVRRNVRRIYLMLDGDVQETLIVQT